MDTTKQTEGLKTRYGIELFHNYFGLLVDDGEGARVYGYENQSAERPNKSVTIPTNGGVYGYVGAGSILILDGDKTFTVEAGYWFSTRNTPEILFTSKEYRIAIWQIDDYFGTLTTGLVEDFGRLKYINDCHDSILSSPIQMGEPCLNALYMPEGILQAMHTHPSFRAGFIINGGARCVTPEKEFDLNTGTIFYLEKEAKHNFRSDFGAGVTMSLVAFHPDSDFGPTDDNHPMLNRTEVDGVSANTMKDIQTRE